MRKNFFILMLVAFIFALGAIVLFIGGIVAINNGCAMLGISFCIFGGISSYISIDLLHKASF